VRRSSAKVRRSEGLVRRSGPKVVSRSRINCITKPHFIKEDLRSFDRCQGNFSAFCAGSNRAPHVGMAGVRRFEELDCWKLATELKVAIYELLERPHVKIDRDFCDDARDAAKSAPANIAEGFGRHTDADFARFLDIARGSLNESRNHIGDARDRKYIDEQERSALDSLASRAVGAVAGLQRYLRGGGGKRKKD